MNTVSLARVRDSLSRKHFIRKKLENYHRNKLLKEAESYLDSKASYTGAEREAIIRDYLEVCLDTQLRIPGICNLEFIARYVIDNRLEGAFVECGTWRGGALGYWARSFIRNGGDQNKTRLYGFDSFEGMPRMTMEDGDKASRWLYGKSLDEVDRSLVSGEFIPSGVNAAPEDVCRATVESSGYRKDSITIIKGWFQNTLPERKSEIGPIAVLRLDADLYEATKFCLETLYENVVSGGAVIIDDYGCFEGCAKAVDEFLASAGEEVKLQYYGNCGWFFFKSLSRTEKYAPKP